MDAEAEMKVFAKSLNDETSHFERAGEVVEVRCLLGTASVSIEASGRRARVDFSDVEALRVMDERDLMEYWPPCSSPNGWLFQILDGGWLSQERSREGSCIRFVNDELKEFLVAGVDDCVSVLAMTPPRVTFEAASERK